MSTTSRASRAERARGDTRRRGAGSPAWRSTESAAGTAGPTRAVTGGRSERSAGAAGRLESRCQVQASKGAPGSSHGAAASGFGRQKEGRVGACGGDPGGQGRHDQEAASPGHPTWRSISGSHASSSTGTETREGTIPPTVGAASRRCAHHEPHRRRGAALGEPGELALDHVGGELDGGAGAGEAQQHDLAPVLGLAPLDGVAGQQAAGGDGPIRGEPLHGAIVRERSLAGRKVEALGGGDRLDRCDQHEEAVRAGPEHVGEGAPGKRAGGGGPQDEEAVNGVQGLEAALQPGPVRGEVGAGGALDGVGRAGRRARPGAGPRAGDRG